MGKTIKLTESEIIQLIEDTARKQILLNAKSKDMNFDNKISKVTKRFTKVLNRLPESTANEKLLEAIRKETINLREAGYSYLIIGESFKLCFNTLNEDLMSWVKHAFSGASDTAKEYAYDWVLSLFGIPDGNFKDALVISLGEIDIADIPKLMTDCKFTANAVADGCVEYVMQLVITDVTGQSGAGMLGKLIRNTLEKQLETTEVHQNLMKRVQELICNSDNSLRSIEQITSDITSGDAFAGEGGSSREGGSMASILGV